MPFAQRAICERGSPGGPGGCAPGPHPGFALPPPTHFSAGGLTQDVFQDNPKVPQATIAALAEGSWIDDRESVIFIGDSGTGKTMLATALAVCACHQGRRVRFTTLAALANELQEAQGNRELARVVGRYARTELIVCDELGYLGLPDGAAELVFQVLSERHERGSLIITTNLPFGEWTKVFPDARLAKAVVDRLTHRAHIIDTGNESWRFRHGLERQGRKRA